MRVVNLPENIQGRLYLHSMPGRYEDIKEFINEAKKENINLIVSLASKDEIKNKSPSYFKMIINPDKFLSEIKIKFFPIKDFGVPEAKTDYFNFVNEIAKLILNGKRILIHCGAGIGRTGTFAICLLLALKINLEESVKTIENTGSHPETKGQEDLIYWFKNQL